MVERCVCLRGGFGSCSGAGAGAEAPELLEGLEQREKGIQEEEKENKKKKQRKDPGPRQKDVENKQWSGCCINEGFEPGAARTQELFHLISSQGASIPTQRKTKKDAAENSQQSCVKTAR